MATHSRFDSHALIDNRQIRIFLSSTFSDMQAERTALLRTFDALRLKANRRNVDLSVLDLRWGVTDDEARSGKVIAVCLNEIEHSHPFFIGLLGSRYGYAPEMTELERNPDLLERYPWLADDIAEGRSITEMEMLYGVLRNEADIDAAFYIKQTDTPDDDPRQTALKAKIRGQQHYPVADYATIEELCTQVEAEVTSILDRHFPETEVTPLDRERTAQRAYINSRHAHFVGREEELQALDDYARSDRRHLVVTGDSGMGKSALLARWCRRNEENGDFNLVYHFMGNSFSGNNYESVLRHLCDEIYDLYQIDRTPDRQEKPEDEAQRLVSELRQREKPLVVVIDGINQLLAPKDEKLLLWLPSANDKVKYLFTTLRDDETMRTFERRSFEVLDLQPLTDAQRRQFAVGYLENVGKHLDDARWQRILSDPENRNTLVLRTFLDELICFGSHEQLDARINSYLGTASIPEFFDRVLRRMEQDYDNGQQLVRHALTLIAVSERGLSEEELLAITGFRQMDWHLFYCAFFNHLVVREGLITFSHQYVAAAVAHRYATDDAKAMASYRREIVAYFDQQPTSNRRTSELAHQYYHLEDYFHLHDTLLSFEAFSFFNDTNKPLLAKYWRALLSEGKNNYSLEDYLNLNSMVDELAMAASFNDIGSFVQEYFADYSVGLNYYSKTLEIRERVLGLEHYETATSYNNIGSVYDNLGAYDKALEYHDKALAIYEKMLGTEHHYTSTSYNNIGLVYYNLGDYEKAMEYNGKALAIREKVFGAEHPNTALSYNNIGFVYYNFGDYDKAMEYYGKALAIREKVLGEEHPDTATSYGCIGAVYDDLGDYNKALEYYGKDLAICEKILGTEHSSTATTYNNIGCVYDDLGDYNKALWYHGKALAIREKVLGTEHPNTAQSYNNIGSVYDSLGDYDKALKYYCKALAIREKVLGEEHPGTANSYNSIGYIYYCQCKYDKALSNFCRSLEIRQKVLGLFHPDTVQSYNNIGCAYRQLGNYDKAIELFNKALNIYEKKYGPDHSDTIKMRDKIADVKAKMGQ